MNTLNGLSRSAITPQFNENPTDPPPEQASKRDMLFRKLESAYRHYLVLNSPKSTLNKYRVVTSGQEIRTVLTKFILLHLLRRRILHAKRPSLLLKIAQCLRFRARRIKKRAVGLVVIKSSVITIFENRSNRASVLIDKNTFCFGKHRPVKGHLFKRQFKLQLSAGISKEGGKRFGVSQALSLFKAKKEIRTAWWLRKDDPKKKDKTMRIYDKMSCGRSTNDRQLILEQKELDEPNLLVGISVAANSISKMKEQESKSLDVSIKQEFNPYKPTKFSIFRKYSQSRSKIVNPGSSITLDSQLDVSKEEANITFNTPSDRFWSPVHFGDGKSVGNSLLDGGPLIGFQDMDLAKQGSTNDLELPISNHNSQKMTTTSLSVVDDLIKQRSVQMKFRNYIYRGVGPFCIKLKPLDQPTGKRATYQLGCRPSFISILIRSTPAIISSRVQSELSPPSSCTLRRLSRSLPGLFRPLNTLNTDTIYRNKMLPKPCDSGRVCPSRDLYINSTDVNRRLLEYLHI